MALNSLVHYPYSYWLSLKYHARVLLGVEKTEPVKNDGYPMPPVPLRYRVHGSVKPGGFCQVGMNCARDIEKLLEDHGRSYTDFRRVLDFGCGCGRVLRFLPRIETDAGQVVGTDIDPMAIAWCRRHLAFARWGVNGALPPLGYPSESFDFVFAISVFTHLDEYFQNAWLHEIDRILRPNGLFLATLHGESFAERVREENVATIADCGICCQVGQTGVMKLDGLPDYYQATFHSRHYVEHIWGEMFEILEYREKGMNGRQDAVLLRKRSQVKP
jgi:SAM-dependent methyltransferase